VTAAVRVRMRTGTRSARFFCGPTTKRLGIG
jgi:hypothetical protein